MKTSYFLGVLRGIAKVKEPILLQIDTEICHVSYSRMPATLFFDKTWVLSTCHSKEYRIG